MVTNNMSSEESFTTFLDKSFTKAVLTQLCEKKGVRATGTKRAIINQCLELYDPLQLIKELDIVKEFQWYDKLFIACLLRGSRTASEILSDTLTEEVLKKQIPIAAFGVITHSLLSIEESKDYLRRRIHRLKKQGVILMNPRERKYHLNHLMTDYFFEVFGSIGGEQLWEDAVSYASRVMGRDIGEFLLPQKELSQFLIKNIGKGTWSASPLQSWVSKMDITQFLRCKYRVFVMHNRNLVLDELRNPVIIQSLLNKGRQFEGNLISQMSFEPVASLESVLEKDVIFRSSELIQNQELGIRGIVDLIRTGKGELYPIEIKYHKDITRMDRLELAFYWKLLEPLRMGKPSSKGYVLLSTGELVEVILTSEDFIELDNLIVEVRKVKEDRAEPVLGSECKLCRLYQVECLPQAREKGSLTLIHGIASTRQEELYSLGLRDIQALATVNTSELHQAWHQLTRYAPSIEEIHRMQIHAKALKEQKPIYFGVVPPFGDELLILDLEYDNFLCIWLIGILISSKGDIRYYQLFADEMAEEKEILNSFTELLNEYTTHQVVTWDGLRADIPQLNAAWRRYDLSKDKLDELEHRHFDLYNFFLRNCRFPLGSFGLKEIDEYLGFRRKLGGMDGLEAQMLYHQYLNITNHSSQERSRIKQLLLDYNREDLEALLFVLNRLRVLADDENP
ncbi:TM0106 family RecB-like putative nuclease [Chloroflexota bacterium]